MNLSKYPLAKVLFPYIFGILLAYLIHFPVKICQLSLFILAFFCLFSLALWPVKSYYCRFLKTVVMTCSFFFAGFCATNFQMFADTDLSDEVCTPENHCELVRVLDYPALKEKSVKMTVELISPGKQLHVPRKVLLYLQKSKQTEQIKYGDVLFLNAKITKIQSSTNPYAFDYQKFMRRKQVYYTAYARQDAVRVMAHKPASRLRELSHLIQMRLSRIFDKVGMQGEELDVVNAILLGAASDMDPELKSSYAAAGVSHILCVSGMHVGVIYMIVNFLLQGMNFCKGTRFLKAFLLLLLIWLYANITGLSPSVTRSAAMFTFVTVGSLLNRNVNVFHSLLASLFILLVINPLLLFEVGFQLSYLAVLGIVLFQPVIADVYQCRTRIGDYFWNLLSVSVAAQLATFPISIYYFGQFPNYFILSNLSVIALSFVVMISGVVLLTFSFIPFLAKLLVWLLTREIKIMNFMIHFVEGLPGSVTSNIDYAIVQVILLYVAMFFFYFFIKKKYHVLWWVACGSFTLFSVAFVYKKWNWQQQQAVVVYDIKKSVAIGCCYQEQCVLFSDSIKSVEDSRYKFSIQNHHRKEHLQSVFVPVDTDYYKTSFLYKNGPLIQFMDTRYYLLKRKMKLWKCENPLPVDVLLLQYNPEMLPENVAEALCFKRVIADGTNTKFYVDRWRSYCEAHHVPFECTGGEKIKQKRGELFHLFCLADRTRLELATPCVTGMYSNQTELPIRFVR